MFSCNVCIVALSSPNVFFSLHVSCRIYHTIFVITLKALLLVLHSTLCNDIQIRPHESFEKSIIKFSEFVVNCLTVLLLPQSKGAKAHLDKCSALTLLGVNNMASVNHWPPHCCMYSCFPPHVKGLEPSRSFGCVCAFIIQPFRIFTSYHLSIAVSLTARRRGGMQEQCRESRPFFCLMGADDEYWQSHQHMSLGRSVQLPTGVRGKATQHLSPQQLATFVTNTSSKQFHVN